MTELVVNGARRYLFWVSYDGSKFMEMAKGHTGYGVIDLIKRTLLHTLPVEDPSDIKLAPSSRTDAKVHAIRTPVIVHAPATCGLLDESRSRKESFTNRFNTIANTAVADGLRLLDYHSVSPGFQQRHNVSYRRYVYRLYAPLDEDYVAEGPSIVCFSEQPYAWRVPSTFDVEKASEACRMLDGVHNLASFWKHTERDRRKGLYKNTEKNIFRISIEPGEPYSFPNEMFRYYNITVVSRSFLREQIRRMVAVIVACACGERPLSVIEHLLDHPHPQKFIRCGFLRAPANGLFLADVVYDPRMFLNPVPYFHHGWDDVVEDLSDG